MFIDNKRKFIYLRPSKTASTSLMNFFQLLYADEIYLSSKSLKISSSCIYVHNRDVDGKENTELVLNRGKITSLHWGINEIKNIFKNEEDFNKFSLIISIRNPYQHAISYYRFQKTQILRRLEKKNNFKFFIKNPFRATAQHMFYFQSKWSFYVFLKFFYKPYTPWLDPYFEGREIYIIRAEHINDDTKSICDKFDIAYSEVSHLNSSYDKTNPDRDIFYNKFSKELIEKEYSKIIEEFGYSYTSQ